MVWMRQRRTFRGPLVSIFARSIFLKRGAKKEGKMKRANLDERFKAFMIDWAFWGILGLIVFFIVQLFTKDTSIITIFVIPFAFWLWFKDLAGNGIGKRRKNLSIINVSTGKHVKNPFILIIRNMTITLWIIDLPLLFFDKESRRFGEKITNTKVIRNG